MYVLVNPLTPGWEGGTRNHEAAVAAMTVVKVRRSGRVRDWMRTFRKVIASRPNALQLRTIMQHALRLTTSIFLLLSTFYFSSVVSYYITFPLERN